MHVRCADLLPSVRGIAEFSRFDQCRFGLKAPNGQPIQKPTRLLSNMPSIAQAFNGAKCMCTVPHVQVQGSMYGRRLSTWAQRYPPDMVAALAGCSFEYCQTLPPA